MKIVQIIPDFRVGGAEIMLENLVYELQSKPCELTVISLYSNDTIITQRMIEKGVDIIYLNKRRGFDLSQIFKLYKLFRRIKPDVIHTHLHSAKYAFVAAFFAKIPKVIHTVHNVADKEATGLDRFVNRIFFKSLNAIPVALSSLIQRSISNIYGIDIDKVPVVHNGMPLDNYKMKTEYSLKDTVNIMHIGRFSVQKNHSGLIEAFEVVHQKVPNAVLNLYGDGELLEEIKRLVNNKGLSDNVVFHGVVDNIPERFSDNDIFCLPSNYEGIPMTLIEAMASAMPIVATDVGGIPDMLDDEVDALICDNEQKKISECICRLIESGELRGRLGENAYNRSKEFSSLNMSDQYFNIYKSI